MGHITDIKGIDLNIGDEIAVAFRRSTSVYMRTGFIVDIIDKPVSHWDWQTKQSVWSTEYKLLVTWKHGSGIPENPNNSSKIDYDSSRIVKIG